MNNIQIDNYKINGRDRFDGFARRDRTCENYKFSADAYLMISIIFLE